MRVSFLWLRELLPQLDSEVAVVAERLTMAGIEVEEVRPLAASFSRVVVAQVTHVSPHPHSKKLQLCTVEVGGDEPLSIVCGAPNVIAGAWVPCALPGARLPLGEIATREVRGVRSQGMLCSREELGMEAKEEGLWLLPLEGTGIKTGSDLRETLHLADDILDLKPTPNRGDSLSVLGVAREIAAIYHLPPPVIAITAPQPDLADSWPVRVMDPAACPQYCGQLFRSIQRQTHTPLWMKLKLERCGQRSINAVVDITNYIMLEMGQPLHAFDAQRLEGAVTVRRSLAGEQITLLDGQTVTPSLESLLICDEKKPLAVAGVMGGLQSGVMDETRDIFLESAFFSPSVIQGQARKLQVSSEAAHRFERGVDPMLPPLALARAASLIKDICGGHCGPPVIHHNAEFMPARTPVVLDCNRVFRTLGMELPMQKMTDLLQRVATVVEVQNATQIRLTPPSHRFDLAIAEDWVEEIARLYGYENIPSHLPQGSLQMVAPSGSRQDKDLRQILVARDYQEVITYSFVSRQLEDDFAESSPPVAIANPMTNAMEVMRSTLLGSLVSVLTTNLSQQQERIRLFEISRCFGWGTEKDASMAVAGIRQTMKIAMLAFGDVMPLQWGTSRRPVDFFDVMGDVEALLSPRQFECRPHVHPAFHPDRAAALWLGEEKVGVLGQIHPSLAQRYNLPTPPILAEIFLAPLLESVRAPFVLPSRFPEVLRDLAFILPSQVSAKEALGALMARASTLPLVRNIQLFDLYKGENLGQEKKSLAFRITLGAANKTLDEVTITSTMSYLEEAAKLVGAQVRRADTIASR